MADIANILLITEPHNALPQHLVIEASAPAIPNALSTNIESIGPSKTIAGLFLSSRSRPYILGESSLRLTVIYRKSDF